MVTSRDIDPQEAMMIHCFTAYVKQFGDVFLPYNEATKRLVADNSIVITPSFDDGGEVVGFNVELIVAGDELRESNCACLGIPHREDCRLRVS